MDKDIKTGDILFRQSNAKGPFYIPFCFVCSKLSRSKYSHASIALVESYSIDVVEMGDDGTERMSFEKWTSLCVGGYYSVYRPIEEVDPEVIEKHTRGFLEEDPDYDFTFKSEIKYYCTESVAEIYRRAGKDLFEPMLIKDVIPFREYMFLWPFNWLVGKITGKSLAMDVPLYFVGNEKKGMLASKKIRLVKFVKNLPS